MEHEARRDFARLGPGLPGGDGIGVAVEGMDGRAAIEDRAGIAARAEGRVDHHVARLRAERRDNLVEQDRDVRRAHLRLPFCASAWSRRQETLAPSKALSMA